ncbi:hypothetical protein [Streptomyces endophyticus]|uniref:Uncharacterized protein n=1 Tax=Streptomyces endophyticus TaxID=714166 RepID=A0ABU6FC66_9ACTN|nr:hypothetical protein [Streptomyces endophyticus]MEB8341222.1 hypothetical protein [Streptomyces endophyticus]
MRLGKALATGIAEEAPRETERPEMDELAQELAVDAAMRDAVVRDAVPEPAEVPAER